MKIAICDDLNDDKRCLFNNINTYCQTNFIHATITEYDSGESLLEKFKKYFFNIIFLEIYMKYLFLLTGDENHVY